jgi:hypothetical protein
MTRDQRSRPHEMGLRVDKVVRRVAIVKACLSEKVRDQNADANP